MINDHDHHVAPVFDEGQSDHHDAPAHNAGKELCFGLAFLKHLHLVDDDDDQNHNGNGYDHDNAVKQPRFVHQVGSFCQ